MSDVIDPSDMKFYEQEARKYCEQIERYYTDNYILEVPLVQLSYLNAERRELQLLMLCGNYKKAVDKANRIINRYFIKPLLGDLCER